MKARRLLLVLTLASFTIVSAWVRTPDETDDAVRDIRKLVGEINKLDGKKKDIQRRIESSKNFRLDANNNVMQADRAKFTNFKNAMSEGERLEADISVKKDEIRRAGTGLSGATGPQVKKLAVALSDMDWRLRTVMAEVMGGVKDAEAEAALAEQLGKEREITVKVSIIDALKARNARSPAAIAVLSKILEDKNEKSWTVKYSIVQLISQNATKELLIPMAASIQYSDGRLLVEILDALKKTTGVDKGPQASAWVAWLKENMGVAKPPAVPKGIRIIGFFDHPEAQEAAPPQEDKNQYGTFYGIPVKTKNVVFVIDRSGSMKEKSNWAPDTKAIDTGGAGDPGKPDGDLKIDIAKYELIKALKALPDGAMVNIVFFNHAFEEYKDTMTKLTKETRQSMIKFVKDLKPEGATNIYDPSERAMSMQAGGGAGGGKVGMTTTDKVSEGSPDTIFLLTDGKPNFGQIKESGAIRTKIKELNQLKKITINTIAVTGTDFQEADAEFLKGIASDNFGQFVKR